MVDAWALDFCRAFNERPKIIRFIVLLLMGKYARNEYLGMEESLNKNWYNTHWEYDLQHMDYHDEFKDWIRALYR